MRVADRDDRTIMEAVKASNNGQHGRAAALYQEAGNQYRNPADKQTLWDAAEKARRIRDSD